MKAVLLLAMAAIALPAAAPDLDWYYRLARFDRPYLKMLKLACGWPDQQILDLPCDPRGGRIDAREFKAARAASCEFFQTSCK